MIRSYALPLSLILLFSAPAHAVCSWSVLKNATTADANQVMNNFDCLAPTFSPILTANNGQRGLKVEAPTGNFTVFPYYDATYGVLLNAYNAASSGYTPMSFQGSAYIFTLGNAVMGLNPPVSANSASRIFQMGSQMILQNVVGDQVLLGDNIRHDTDGSWTTIASGTAVGIRQYDGGTYFHSHASVPAGTSLNSTWDSSDVRMAILNGGNVGIGTKSPSTKLHVVGEIRVDSLAAASATNLCINANVLSSCSSSIRYKERIEDASFGLKEVSRMRPVTFKWKGRSDVDFGLIAEEIAAVNPLFVTYKNGKVEGVKYPQLTAVLIGAIKQQQAAISALEIRNRELGDRLDRLERQAMRQAAK